MILQAFYAKFEKPKDEWSSSVGAKRVPSKSEKHLVSKKSREYKIIFDYEFRRPGQVISGWQAGHIKLVVLPVLIFSIMVPQTGQGWFSL